MSDAPPSPEQSRPAGHQFAHQHGPHHGHQHGQKQPKPKRPEGSRHGSDWISRLHRRHDANHHPSREEDEEEAPLLTQSHQSQDDVHEDHSEGGQPPVTLRGAFGILKSSIYSLIAAALWLLTSATSLARQSIQKAGHAVKKAGNAIGRGARQTAEAVKTNPKRVMASIILLLALFSVAIGTLFGIHLKQDELRKACTTPACIRAADNIIRNLDPDAVAATSISKHVLIQPPAADPCSDFEKYVCGGFGQHHDLASNQGHLDAGTLVTTKFEKILRDIVEGPSSKFSGKDKSIFKKLNAHYTACMAEDAVPSKGLKPLKDTAEVIKSLLGTHQPVQPGPPSRFQISTTAHQVSVTAFSEALAYLAKIGVSALADIFVAADDLSPSKHSIHVSPVQHIGLAAPKQYENSKLVGAYRAVTKDTLKHFFDVNVNTSNIFHTSQGQRPRLTNILSLAQGVVDFELKLAMITPSNEHGTSHNKLNPSAFETLFPQLSLKTFAKALAPPDYQLDSVIVTSPDYLHKLSFLLQSTSKEVLEAFLVWKAVQHHADRIEDPALKPLKEFHTSLKGSRVDQPPERWRQCVECLREDLPWISAWFSLQNTEADLEKTIAAKIVNDVTESFVASLIKVGWMDEIDIRKSANKIHAIDQQIGSPKGLNAAFVDSYYSTLSISDDAFFGNKIAAAEFVALRKWSKLNKDTKSKEWDVTPLSTKPDYDASLNRLILPAALLQKPLSYDNSVPDSVLYGSFGAISGHGISQALGSVGSHYSKNGTLRDPWTDKTRKAFEKKARCLVDHYSGYTVEGPDGKAHRVDGKSTLSENMADIAGVHAAFKAWTQQEKKRPSPQVPGLENFSKEQLFWIAFGSSLCSVTTKERAVHQVQVSKRAPERVRLLGIVANSKEFLEAFKCPTKKPKCDFW